MERTDLQIFPDRVFKLTGRIIRKFLSQTTRQSIALNDPIDISTAEISGAVILDPNDLSQNILIAGSIVDGTNGTYELNITNENRDLIFNFNLEKIGYEYSVVLTLTDGTGLTLLKGTIYLRRS